MNHYIMLNALVNLKFLRQCNYSEKASLIFLILWDFLALLIKTEVYMSQHIYPEYYILSKNWKL
jgi:hypothetical protein